MNIDRFSVLMMLTVLPGCGGCGGEPLPEDDALPAETRLIRASMALRGIRPEVDELRLVMYDDAAMDDIVSDWLNDPEFGETIRDMHAEQLRLRSDLHERMLPVGAMQYSSIYAIHEAISEGPLALVEDIVVSGAPYTDIVTSPTLRVNAVGAEIWGAPYDEDGETWQPFTPEDGRPPWGILSDGALWIRHVSNGNNYQRARANMVADALLCADFHTRDIPLGDDIDLSDDAAVAEAVNNNPACVSCHQSLDPLGGFLWGYINTLQANQVAVVNSEDCIPLSELTSMGNFNQVSQAAMCYPLEPWIGDFTFESEDGEYAIRDAWEPLDLRAPGYFGLGTDQDALGSYIAEDPRFLSCTVQRFYGYLAQTDPESVPLAVQGELLSAFEDAALDARELAKAVVLSDAFAAAPLQTTRPEQYARLVENLTGFRWRTDLDAFDGDASDCQDDGCVGEADLMGSDLVGFRSMAGGMDGYRVTSPTHTDTPTRQLVVARYAAEAAGFAVDSEFSGSPRLLTEVSASTTDEDAIRAQLVLLHLRILGEDVAAGSDAISETYALFEAGLAGGGDAASGWRVVLSALLQSPEVLFY